MARSQKPDYEYEEDYPAQRCVYAPARGRRRGSFLRAVMFFLAAVVLLGAIGLVVWHSRFAAAEQEDQSTPAATAEAEATAAPASEDLIVVAIDPGHGGVNPNIGAEDFGGEYNGLQESVFTLQVAELVCEKLRSDGRFSPYLTNDGTVYLKPSERGEAAQTAGAELFLSIHLNYDSTLTASGFECYAAPPRLATNADSVRFGELLAARFSALGLSLRGENGVRYLYYGSGDSRIIAEAYDTTQRSEATFTVLEACGCPAVLCEMGFITSDGDMAILSGTDGNEAAAEACYQSILEYFALGAA